LDESTLASPISIVCSVVEWGIVADAIRPNRVFAERSHKTCEFEGRGMVDQEAVHCELLDVDQVKVVGWERTAGGKFPVAAIPEGGGIAVDVASQDYNALVLSFQLGEEVVQICDQVFMVCDFDRRTEEGSKGLWLGP